MSEPTRDPYIDPKTQVIITPGQVGPRYFTHDEALAFKNPPCPTCGDPVRIEFVDITRLVESDTQPPGRVYGFGKWECRSGREKVRSMSDLLEFLRARYAEDAELANDAKDDRDGIWMHVQTKGQRSKVVDSLGYSLTEFDDVESQPWWTNPHIARHDPARVLREVEAKRRIVELHAIVHRNIGWMADGDEEYGEIPVCGLCVPRHSHFRRREDVPEGPCATVRLLALPYADHEDGSLRSS